MSVKKTAQTQEEVKKEEQTQEEVKKEEQTQEEVKKEEKEKKPRKQRTDKPKSKIKTKASIKKDEMREFIKEGLESGKIKRKEYKEFKEELEKISLNKEIDLKAQWSQTKELFWKMFSDRVNPSIYNAFDGLDADLPKKTRKKKNEEDNSENEN